MRIILSILYAPIIFFSLNYFNTELDDALILKAFPLIIAVVITFLIGVSYIKKNSMIFHFAQKFSKADISEEEKAYIHHSTLFWIGVCFINILIHGVIFFDTNESIWIFYSSIGWYFLFGFAFIIQMIHKKIYFKKDKNV